VEKREDAVLVNGASALGLRNGLCLNYIYIVTYISKIGGIFSSSKFVGQKSMLQLGLEEELTKKTTKYPTMKQLLVQSKFEVKGDTMHKLDAFLSFQPSGVFLSSLLFGKKKKKERECENFFSLPTSGSPSTEELCC